MEELLNLDNWNWRQLTQEQILVLALAGGILLILVVIVLLVRRRHRRDVGAALGVRPELFLGRNACFYKVVTALGKRGLAVQLGRLEGAEGALRILRESGRGRSKRPERGGSLFSKVSEKSDAVDAAMVTIIRAVCMDEELFRALPSEVVDDVDRLLDSLTP